MTAVAIRAAVSDPSPRTPQLTVGVIGLGYAGLPQAVAFAEAGHRVMGVDIDPDVIAALRAGRSPVDTVADEAVRGLGPRFRPAAEPTGLEDCSVLLICVPTPLGRDGRPDLGALRSATSMVSAGLRPGQLVVVESTVHPGVTDTVVKPILERSGLRTGVHFNLAFAPERVDPGNAHFDPTNTPKVVGGYTSTCARRAEQLYRGIVPVVHVTKGLREAEASKMLENTYRQVNLALVHEFAAYCSVQGIDVVATIDAAATKPFGFQAFYPGAGVGGHCIPVDPMYLAYSAREVGSPMAMVELAQQINDVRPRQVVADGARLLAAAGVALDGARVLVLGVTYKPGVADVRNTPAVPIVRALIEAGATVSVHDPLVAELRVDASALPVVPDLELAVRSADLVLLAQRHACYDARLLHAATVLQVADARQPT